MITDSLAKSLHPFKLLTGRLDLFNKNNNLFITVNSEIAVWQVDLNEGDPK